MQEKGWHHCDYNVKFNIDLTSEDSFHVPLESNLIFDPFCIKNDDLPTRFRSFYQFFQHSCGLFLKKDYKNYHCPLTIKQIQNRYSLDDVNTRTGLTVPGEIVPVVVYEAIQGKIITLLQGTTEICFSYHGKILLGKKDEPYRSIRNLNIHSKINIGLPKTLDLYAI